MNGKDIIAMAQQAGFEELFKGGNDWVCFTEEIERFAALVAAAAIEQERKEFAVHAVDIARKAVKEENEACAKFLESTQLGSLPNDTALHYARLLKGFADGIRARKEYT